MKYKGKKKLNQAMKNRSKDTGLGYWPNGRPVQSGIDALRYQQTAGGRLCYPWNIWE